MTNEANPNKLIDHGILDGTRSFEGKIGTVTTLFKLGNESGLKNDVVYKLDWDSGPANIRKAIPHALTTAFLADVPAITLQVSWKDVYDQGGSPEDLSNIILESVAHAAERTKTKPFTLTLYTKGNPRAAYSEGLNNEFAYETLVNTFVRSSYGSIMNPKAQP